MRVYIQNLEMTVISSYEEEKVLPQLLKWLQSRGIVVEKVKHVPCG